MHEFSLEVTESVITKAVGLLPVSSEIDNHRFAMEYKAGNLNSLRKLQEGLMCLVCSIGHKEYVTHKLYTVFDLIAAGLIGIEKAVWKYEPKKGTFANIAYFYIRKEMFMEKKRWGLSCTSLDLQEESGSGSINSGTLMNSLVESEIEDKINLLRLKAKRGYVSIMKKESIESKQKKRNYDK
jgi:DNA-directed RNA polymerase specialized sigma subunit